MNAKLEQYARLAVRVGVNIREGQNLVISCPVECAYFARMCATEAYAAGCREVIVNWSDDYLSREKFLKASDDVFDHIPSWQKALLTENAKQGSAFLHIGASDPEKFRGVDPDRLRRNSLAAAELSEYRELSMSNYFPWCIVSVPIPSWARKVFPGLDDEAAMAALWDRIFDAVRICDGGDAVEQWQNHIATLKQRQDKLNALHIKQLHYKNSLGTDLTVELPEGHQWLGGSEVDHTGVEFVANMPTEEVFTAPKKTGVNGVAVASMPLVYNGNIIEDFSLTFEDGRIVAVSAAKGEEFLRAATSMDDGAAFLGEVALVPYDSAIRRAGVLFYNTLFDENASCHFAFGSAYPACVKGGSEMDKEQLAQSGLNSSITHVDFMIGTSDLSITALCEDGSRVPIFADGMFAM
ncbi:MAG: aminopeptidase [Clostridia bacterium]|nr:aminopeptidase [Clostridia bacterium]